MQQLGQFQTAEQAAKACAAAARSAFEAEQRQLEQRRVQAVTDAATENLEFICSSNNNTGYMGVTRIVLPSCHSPDEYDPERVRYTARIFRKSTYTFLGQFLTAEEAALAYAKASKSAMASEEANKASRRAER